MGKINMTTVDVKTNEMTRNIRALCSYIIKMVEDETGHLASSRSISYDFVRNLETLVELYLQLDEVLPDRKCRVRDAKRLTLALNKYYSTLTTIINNLRSAPLADSVSWEKASQLSDYQGYFWDNGYVVMAIEFFHRGLLKNP